MSAKSVKNVKPSKSAQQDEMTKTVSPSSANSDLRYHAVFPGDPAPRLKPEGLNPHYIFEAAGRYQVLCFFGSAANQDVKPSLKKVLEDNRALFDDKNIAFFGVSIDPEDQKQSRVAEKLPGIRYLWDFHGVVSRLYGSVPLDAKAGEKLPVKCLWYVIDPGMRIMKVIPFQKEGQDAEQLVTYLKSLPPVENFSGIELHAPTLFLPQVLEGKLCSDMIDLYEAAKSSGTLSPLGVNEKQRLFIKDERIMEALRARVLRRILPEIQKAYQFVATEAEQFVVTCDLANDKNAFHAMRNDMGPLAAHRKFTVTVNLNSDFEGGGSVFPEFSQKPVHCPQGGAFVSSSALLKVDTPVSKGKRYQLSLYLYDDASKALRTENLEKLRSLSEEQKSNEQLHT